MGEVFWFGFLFGQFVVTLVSGKFHFMYNSQ